MKRISNFLKHLFVPHKNNDFKPHFFREYSIAVICIFILCLFGVSLGNYTYINKTNMTAAVLPAVLVDLTNSDRINNYKSPLVRNSILDEAARLKAQDMADNSYFAHTSPSGLTPWYWINKVNYKFAYAGENLAVDFTESVDVENAWLNSPSHRKNIMDERFTEIGVATVDAVFEGKHTTFVVQMFGRPLASNNLELPKNDIQKISLNTNNKEDIINKTDSIENGVVKGESLQVIPKLEIINDTKDFIIAKNIESSDVILPIDDIVSDEAYFVEYSTKKQRFILRSPLYLDFAYKIISYIVFVALILMIIIEYKKQHFKNIAYGVFVLILVLFLAYLNREIFSIPFIF